MSNRCLKILLIAIAGLLSPAVQAQQTWALDGVKIYPAPDVPPTEGKVVIAGKKILSVGTAAPGATDARKAPQCDGGVIVAGFQNSHVHFTGEEFRNARQRPAAELDTALTRMLTRYGYTTVFDVASDGDNTLALRNRIEKGEVRGPRILTVGLSLFPSQGLPIYTSHMPRELLDKFPQPGSADEAVQAVRKNLSAGTGGTMIPTLQLFPYELNKERVPAAIAEKLVNETVTELGKFVALGGQVLFGTDVGYMTDYDPTLEYELMAKAGLSPLQILASLTTTPAARWKEQDSRGRIAAGMEADVVVLDADPADSPRNFSAVRCAIRGGEIIYSRE